jgi:hypothetical protein
MVYRCEGNLHFHLMIEIFEHHTIKILGIVDYDVSGNVIAADDILPEELFDGCRAYVCDRFCLNPLHEVFDCHNSEGIIALCWG